MAEAAMIGETLNRIVEWDQNVQIRDRTRNNPPEKGFTPDLLPDDRLTDCGAKCNLCYGIQLPFSLRNTPNLYGHGAMRALLPDTNHLIPATSHLKI